MMSKIWIVLSVIWKYVFDQSKDFIKDFIAYPIRLIVNAVASTFVFFFIAAAFVLGGLHEVGGILLITYGFFDFIASVYFIVEKSRQFVAARNFSEVFDLDAPVITASIRIMLGVILYRYIS